MTIIDSANMQCDLCGVSANHPIMFMPDGWTTDRSIKPVQHFCDICSVNVNIQDDLLMNRRSTDFQAIPAFKEGTPEFINVTGVKCLKCSHDKGEHVGDNWKCISCPCPYFIDPRKPSNWNDPINHPVHYTSHPSGVECIQITEHMNFCIGNAIKYLWRADEKNGIEDLCKAKWYIEREIERRVDKDV